VDIYLAITLTLRGVRSPYLPYVESILLPSAYSSLIDKIEKGQIGSTSSSQSAHLVLTRHKQQHSCSTIVQICPVQMFIRGHKSNVWK